jgi:hypothetical protein
MTLWSVLGLSGMLLLSPTVLGQIPDRVLFDATFRTEEMGIDFMRFECVRLPKQDAPKCWMDEVLVMGCDSGTARIYPRHTSNEEMEISGSLLKRQMTVEVEGAGTRTVFRFEYFPAAVANSAYILTGATMTHHDSVDKRGNFEYQALKGREATIKLPCAIKANGIRGRKDLP